MSPPGAGGTPALPGNNRGKPPRETAEGWYSLLKMKLQDVWALLDRNYLVTVTQRTPNLVFAVVCGSHTYGFASPNSDVDLRGVFTLSLGDVLGIGTPRETVTIIEKNPFDLDWVAHDVKKFVRLLTGHNGHVLEQLYSPLVVTGSAAFDELRELGRGCITRPTARHYLGFARGRRQALREPHPTVKHLLYAYRVLLTGIHMMKTGDVLQDVVLLSEIHDHEKDCGAEEIKELVERKRAGAEAMKLKEGEAAAHERRLDALEEALRVAQEKSNLPDEPTNLRALNDFTVKLRMSTADLET